MPSPLLPWLVAAAATACAAGLARGRERDRAAAREAERRARERRRFELIATNAPGLVCVVDAARRFTYVSPSSRQVLGYAAEALVAQGVIPVHPDDVPHVRAHAAAAFAGERRRYTHRHRHADGRWIWLETDATPLVGSETGEVCFVSRDVTARVESETARQQSVARVRSLVERAAYGIYTSSPDGRFLDANAALATMLGYDSVAELLEADLAAVYVDPEARALLMRQVAEGTLPDWVDLEWRRRDGTPITVRLSARTERDVAGALVRCEAIVEDVTARRRREEAQRRAERLAALGRMLAGTAHELNNPLAAVSGFSQLLLRAELPGDVRQALQTIDREANRAAAVVKDLLTFSRGDAGGGGSEGRAADLNAVARYVAQARRYALEARGVRLELALAPGPLLVVADRPQLEQVLLNLVTNAEQALEPVAEAHARGASTVPTVVVRTSRREGLATVEVVDNGPGIAAADLPLVWDPFWTTKRDGEGTGLGLAVVHEIVSRLGGAADVESAPAQGARFRVALPLAPARDPDAMEADGGAADDANAARRALDVLVVDPDRDAAAFVTRLLARRGHAAVAAHDAAHALALAAPGADVVLLAASLAGVAPNEGDACSLLDRLRAPDRGSAPRIVLVTGGDDDADAEVTPPGVAAVVARPFDVERLRQAIESE
jgi:PAS domain S-box-containing protein